MIHKVVSREIIKPSSPTPSHLKTYNLSIIDQFSPSEYIPVTIFYPNSKLHSNFHARLNDMKNSLSQTLTRYYPFAGRLSQTAPFFVDCNDEGVEFFVAQTDKPLSDFLNNMHREDLDQLFPRGLVWKPLTSNISEKGQTSPLAVQVTQFACGGIAVAVSLSHKIADGSSMCHFCNDWAIMTRSFSEDVKPIDPHFVSFDKTNLNYQGILIDNSGKSSVTRSFMFPDSKITDLKQKVIAMTAESDQPIMNPTRIEVLTWLLYTCALKASRKNDSESFNPTGFVLVTNLRNKMIESLPENTIGNFYTTPAFLTEIPKQLTASTFIGQLRILKMENHGLQNIKSAVEATCIKEDQIKLGDYYVCTSWCRFPLCGIDFGWGKPIKTAIAGTFIKNTFVAIDAPNGDGIEVLVSLEKEEMEVFERDPELLSFC